MFNFKNKNIKIILLVLLVLASLLSYSLMRRDVEGYTNISSHFEKNFKIYTKDFRNGIDYYFLEPAVMNDPHINFSTDTPLSSLDGRVVSKEDVNKNGGIHKYMFKNGYDMYRLTDTAPGAVESYEVYKIEIPFTINLLNSEQTDTVVSNPVEESTITNETSQEILDKNHGLQTQQNTRAKTKVIYGQIYFTFRENLEAEDVEADSGALERIKNLLNSLNSLIAKNASIVDSTGSITTLINPIDVDGSFRRIYRSGTKFVELDLSIEVPLNKSNAIVSQLNHRMFGNERKFMTAVRDIYSPGNDTNDINIIDIGDFGDRERERDRYRYRESSVDEGFGNMFSYFFGKKVKEGMTTALTHRGNILLRIKEGDYSNVLTTSRENLDITIKKSNIVLIQNGELLVKPQKYVAPSPTPISVNNNQTNGSGDNGVQANSVQYNNGNGNCGDTIGPVANGVQNNAGNGNNANGVQGNCKYTCNDSCLIPGSDPALVSNNKSPFYGDTSMFETAMNNPSNPIVNPVNSLNPVEYAQTLFGPDATGLVANTSSSVFANNEVPPVVTDDLNDINNANNILPANESNMNNSNNRNNIFPAYDPKINDNNNNPVPRPVLANFSTFGS